MATQTTNYNLVKPDLTDWADIRVLNHNMDIIDNAMKSISDLAGGGSGGGTSVDLSAYALKSQLDSYLPLSGGNITGGLTINGVPVATRSEIKEGTKKDEEVTSWKTYLPDGRVMMKITVGNQTVVTLPNAMANTQYSVIICDNTLKLDEREMQICNRGISDKTTTSFKVWNSTLVGNTIYKNAGWGNTGSSGGNRYIGACDCIVIGWEA